MGDGSRRGAAASNGWRTNAKKKLPKTAVMATMWRLRGVSHCDAPDAPTQTNEQSAPNGSLSLLCVIMSASLILRNVRLAADSSAEETKNLFDVCIRDGKVAEVREASSSSLDESNTEILDAGGALLIPRSVQSILKRS